MTTEKIEDVSVIRNVVQFCFVLSLLCAAEVAASSVMRINIPPEAGWFWLVFSSFHACRSFSKANQRQMSNRERIKFAILAAVATMLIYFVIFAALTIAYGGTLDAESLKSWAQADDGESAQLAPSIILTFLGDVFFLSVSFYFAAMAFSHPKLFLGNVLTSQ